MNGIFIKFKFKGKRLKPALGRVTYYGRVWNQLTFSPVDITMITESL